MAKDYAKILADRDTKTTTPNKGRRFFNQIKNNFNEFMHYVKNEVTKFKTEGKPDLYRETALLINEIQRKKMEVTESGDVEQVQAIASAELLCQDLTSALNKYDDGFTKAKTPQDEQELELDLANSVIDIMYEYSPAFIAMPGFWNQLKANIINFIDYLGTRLGFLSESLLAGSGDVNKTRFFSSDTSVLQTKSKLQTKLDLVIDKTSQVKMLAEQGWIEENVPGASPGNSSS